MLVDVSHDGSPHSHLVIHQHMFTYSRTTQLVVTHRPIYSYVGDLNPFTDDSDSKSSSGDIRPLFLIVYL
jgi:hypothetical protein